MPERSLGVRVRRLRGEVRQREIERVVALWRSSGSSQSRFCAEQGISTQTLRRWRTSLDGEVRRSKPAFIEVKTPRAETMYEIVLASGACVRIPAGFDEGEVARLLHVARSC